jgi:hydrogenase maturation protease
MAAASLLAPVLVVCCGNPSAGDDALGPLVAEALRAERLPQGVELLELSEDPAGLCDRVDGRAALVIVDGIAGEDCRPGELIDLPWAEARHALSLNSSGGPSTHALGPAQQVALAEQLGVLPPVVRLIGLTIAQARVGQGLSDAVRRRINALVAHVRTTAVRLADPASAPPHQ